VGWGLSVQRNVVGEELSCPGWKLSYVCDCPGLGSVLGGGIVLCGGPVWGSFLCGSLSWMGGYLVVGFFWVGLSCVKGCPVWRSVLYGGLFWVGAVLCSGIFPEWEVCPGWGSVLDGGLSWMGIVLCGDLFWIGVCPEEGGCPVWELSCGGAFHRWRAVLCVCPG
jgi:hypothetical protein